MICPHFERGQALFDLKRYREAIEAYQSALAQNPKFALAYAMIGAASINLRRIREADDAVRKALELEPNLPFAHYVVSFVHEAHRRLSSAEAAIAEAVRLEQSPDFLHRWAVIAEQRRKFPEAISATAQALQRDPFHTPSILLRGKLLAEAGKLDEAHSLYATAMSVNPENPSAHLALGSFQLQSGDSQSALSLLREARRLDPVNANDGKAIALAYGRMIWPLRSINRMLFRWNSLTPAKMWCFFAALTPVLAVGGWLAHSNVALQAPPAIWLVICIALANYLVLPFSLDELATLVGQVALRREFGTPWASLLVRPFIVVPVMLLHFCASFIGFLAAFPSLAIVLCYGAANSVLIRESLRSGAARLTAYICIPFYILQLIVIALAATMADLSTMEHLHPIDRQITQFTNILLPIAFCLSFFNVPLAHLISTWRFRRHPLLNESIN